MDAPGSPRRGMRERVRTIWLAGRLWVIFAGGVIGGVLALSLPVAPRTASVPLQIGEVATQDVSAPHALSYTSEILTEQARQDAESTVSDGYDPPDALIARQQVERLRNMLSFIDAVRGDPFASPDQRLADLSGLTDLRLNAAQATAILELPEARWEALKLEAMAVLEQVMRDETIE